MKEVFFVILLSTFAYFFNEFSNILLFIFLIILCTKIKQKLFFLILLLVSYPLALVSMEDTLLAEIAMTLLFIAVRARAWKASKELELNELLGYFISLSIYFIVPFMASSFVRFVLDLPFNRNINHPLVFIVLSFLLKFAVSLFSVWLIEKKVLNKIVLLEEKKIYTIQLGVSLAIIIAVAEILREMDILGIVSIIMLGFLIAQYAITLFLTYIILKKNTERQELKNLKEQLLMMNGYTVEVEKNYQEMRKFRHDYNNLLLGLSTSPTEKIDKGYLKEMIDYSHKMIDNSVMSFSGISNLKIVPIKSLIVAKLTQALQANLNVQFECLKCINAINIDVVKAIRIIGILLDNSIEAACESEEKKLNILFITTEDSLEITIENSFAGKLPSLSLMNQEGFSKKGKNRGLGLSNIKELLKNDTNAEVNHYSTDGLFVSTLTIKRSELDDSTNYSL